MISVEDIVYKNIVRAATKTRLVLIGSILVTTNAIAVTGSSLHVENIVVEMGIVRPASPIGVQNYGDVQVWADKYDVVVNVAVPDTVTGNVEYPVSVILADVVADNSSNSTDRP